MECSRSSNDSGKMKAHQFPTGEMADPDRDSQPSPTCWCQSRMDCSVASSAISFRRWIRIGRVVKQPVFRASSDETSAE